jgi:glutathione S-transferase
MSNLKDAIGSGRLILRTTESSPFGRKPRMAMKILGVESHIDIVPADTGSETDSLRVQNPLGKMPALVLPNGDVLYDSRPIVEFLDEMAGSHRLLPANGIARYVALTRAALADGIMDAGILVVYEKRFRPEEHYVESWIAHQKGKILRGLAAFEKAPPDPNASDIVSIGLCCALGYLDWRKQVDWRSRHPRLVEWLDRFAAREPACNATLPPDLR